MTDSSQSCPNELAEMNYTGIRVCKRRAHNACDSVNFIVPVFYILSSVGVSLATRLVQAMHSVLSKITVTTAVFTILTD